MKRAFILFTRLPIPGHTKTRLEKYISKDKCADLHRSMLMDIDLTLSNVDADIFIFHTPNGTSTELKHIFNEKYRYIIQKGDDIWERMANAFLDIFSLGYESVILIGADIPSIDSEHINNSFKLLEKSDIVITPTFDDGYCLIGMNFFCPDIFDIESNVDSLGVFGGTLKKVYENNLVASINSKILDIDEEEDILSIISLYYDMENCRNTIKYLKSIGY
ncbi:glycosyltransferase [Peptostreptococcus anaerobius]|uniref:Glycosyltransferase n=1 Tax=Peptostreptococcus porci TaxID=2652282 RepID=A0A6N7WZJ3_9FIRM|nr:TIGR04282 family arsenosugar biosynthesis glycosyltransferase [Peptostreptococcus porci]MST62110.1 glycosyltransferase [Peptostreptococcus porci]